MKAIILIHEIYGKNHFMDVQREKYQKLGFDVFCPDLLNRKVFSYQEMDAAYTYFYENVGLDAYLLIWNLLETLKPRYEEVYIMGYSVGATLAWRCSENWNCSGVIACYGSRIRDYLHVRPQCPVLLIFAEEDCFDVHAMSIVLENVSNTHVMIYPAKHGFMDLDSMNFHEMQTKSAEKEILDFMG